MIYIIYTFLFPDWLHKTKMHPWLRVHDGDPGGTRTPNFQNRNLTFYPLNYGTRNSANIQRIILCS